jgi:hypothetical protein
MKRILAIASFALLATACDPYEDEPGGTPAVTYVWLAGETLTTAPYTFTNIADDAGLFVLIVKANVLLDGASIQATPQSCDPAGDWLTITGTGATAMQTRTDAGEGQWYTCYYPSTASGTEPGGSVWIFWSPPYDAENLPMDVADLDAGTYNFAGTVATDAGGSIDIDVTATVVVP